MKFTSVIGLLFLVSGLVHAEKLDQCQELKDYLKNNIQEYQYSCENNEEGKIKTLSIMDYQMTEEDFEKVQSYDTITDLTYHIFNYGRISQAPNLITDVNYLTNLKNLKNLEKLNINYEVYDNPCTTRCLVYFLGNVTSNTFKDLKNLKELSVFGINLSQENIDEISTLENLETLKLDYCSFEKVKDFSSLSQLEKVSKLSATEGLNYFGGFESDKVPSEFVNQFNNVKSLEVDNCSGINYSQHPDMERLKIGSEKDTSFLKDYKNLKSLTTLPTSDLSTLEYVDSLEDLEIAYIPSSYGFASFPYQDTNFKFSENSHINTLQLYGVALTNERVAEILKLKNLSYLSFVYCDLSTVSKEYIIQLKEFQNRCPFKTYYAANGYNYNNYNDYDSVVRLEDFENKDCDHFTTVAIESEPTEFVYETEGVEPVETDDVDFNDPEPTEYEYETEGVEPVETDDVDFNDPESTEFVYETEGVEPVETDDVDFNDPEPTEYETEAYNEVDEQEPTEVPEPVVIENPEQKFIKNVDEEDESNAESSAVKKSHRRKC